MCPYDTYRNYANFVQSGGQLYTNFKDAQTAARQFSLPKGSPGGAAAGDFHHEAVVMRPPSSTPSDSVAEPARISVKRNSRGPVPIEMPTVPRVTSQGVTNGHSSSRSSSLASESLSSLATGGSDTPTPELVTAALVKPAFADDVTGTIKKRPTPLTAQMVNGHSRPSETASQSSSSGGFQFLVTSL